MLESMKIREISLLDAQCKMNAKRFRDPECEENRLPNAKRFGDPECEENRLPNAKTEDLIPIAECPFF